MKALRILSPQSVQFRLIVLNVERNLSRPLRCHKTRPPMKNQAPRKIQRKALLMEKIRRLIRRIPSKVLLKTMERHSLRPLKCRKTRPPMKNQALSKIQRKALLMEKIRRLIRRIPSKMLLKTMERRSLKPLRYR